ncbi:hypothetical protein [Pseudoneobacillus sp. C159]
MKKWSVGLLCSALVFGAGTAVFAAGTSNLDNEFSFENILPFMEKMHPNSSKEDLKEMYDTCHKNGGMMNENGMPSENMMNKF